MDTSAMGGGAPIARVDQGICQGDDSPPIVWGFGPSDAPEIPDGAQFSLEIAWSVPAWAVSPPATPVGRITASSPDTGLAVDYAAGTVAWTYTAEQSAAIPPGAAADYVLRCRDSGTTRTWAAGRIVGRLGGGL